MGFTKEAMLILSTTALLSLFTANLGSAAVYKVGDSAGWTIGGANVDYHTWAASKTFRVGDILVFEYNRTQHNVLRVSLADYHKCNAGNPITSYSSGNDSITIKGPGHYYYICGFPGHCQAGQKLDVRVLKVTRPADSQSPRPSPRSSPAPAAVSSTTSGRVIAPSPVNNKSSAPSLFLNNGLGLGLGLCLTLFLIVFGAL